MARTASLKPNIGSQASARLGDALDRETDPDLALVRRCARRDASALEELVRRYQQRLYHFTRQMLGSHEDAEEAVQDVFVKVWQQAAHFEARASFTTWLYRIAANVAYDQLRHRKALPQTMGLHDNAAAVAGNAEEEALQGLERSERVRHLENALTRLRPDDRLLLHLHYVEEMEYAEMGRVTGHAYPVLKVRLMRARRRLQALMRDALPQENA